MENETIGKADLNIATGVVIVKRHRLQQDEKHTINSYKELARMRYQSVQERRKIMTMLCGKWHVDNVRVFCSVIPDYYF